MGTLRLPRCLFILPAVVLAGVTLFPVKVAAVRTPGGELLAREIARKGWIAYTARTTNGSYDLFLTRPDGSQRRNFTRSPQWSEFGARFSPDGKWMLFRRAGPKIEMNHDVWGATGVLMLAQADGSDPRPQGTDGGFPWASWSPDGKQIACLYKREGRIRIFEWPSKRLLKELPRQGIFQQMYWSPDGKRVCGTANIQGQDWKILSIEVATGKSTLVSRNLSCTSDWFQKDPSRIIYSSRTPGLGDDYGWTMLMQATADGKERTLIYGERGKHIYYGSTSPDDRYVIFSVPENDGGTDANLAIVRLADSPIIVPDDYTELKELFPNAKPGPVLDLEFPGFEPHWTYTEIPGN